MEYAAEYRGNISDRSATVKFHQSTAYIQTAGLQNLFQLYMPVVDYWVLYDNSNCPAVKLASGGAGGKLTIEEPKRFEELKQMYSTPEEGEKA